jgi:hypothetical protein
MRGVLDALEASERPNLPMSETVGELKRAKALVETGWWAWSPRDNWILGAVNLMKNTEGKYTILDPYVPRDPYGLPNDDRTCARHLLGYISAWEASLNILTDELLDLEGIDPYTASTISRLFHSARDHLIFSTKPALDYLQAMAVPLEHDRQVLTEKGEA